jgi:hypothetical protein
MITAQQQEFFLTTHFESGGIWRSTAGETRGLVARLRGILSGEGAVTLEFGADDAWRLSVGGVVFSDRGFLDGYRPLACIRAIEPGLALGILTRGRVRLRDSLAAVNCGQSSFLLPAATPSASIPPPHKVFSVGDLSWIDRALGGAEFCLVRPGGQFAAAGPWLGAMVGSVRNWRFHAIIEARLLHRAIRFGPYAEYAFTPARLWMYGNYLSCEIPADSRRPAFDPSPLIGKVRSYPMRIEVEAVSAKEFGETIYEYSTLAIGDDALTIQHYRNLIRLRAKLEYSGAAKKWRLRSRPLLHALSRTEPAHVYLPERSLDPVGIECAGRWMWILPQQEFNRWSDEHLSPGSSEKF